MKIGLLCVGKLSQPFLRDGVAEYAGRLQRYTAFSCAEIKEARGGARAMRDQEGERLLARVPEKAFLVALDEKGQRFRSEQLAGFLEEHMLRGTAELLFVIGGAYGFSDRVRQRADLLLALSSLTLTHQMARLLLLEQLYRGFTIVRNEPYHNR